MYHDLDDATLVTFGGYTPQPPVGHGSEAPLGGRVGTTEVSKRSLQESLSYLRKERKPLWRQNSSMSALAMSWR